MKWKITIIVFLVAVSPIVSGVTTASSTSNAQADTTTSPSEISTKTNSQEGYIQL